MEERFNRVIDLLSEVDAELERLIRAAPAYAVDATRFLKAELRVVNRRVVNARRAIEGKPSQPIT